MPDKPTTHLPILETERLTLRELRMTDEKNIFTLRSDKEINKYLDRNPSKSIDDARNFINQIIDNMALYWAITLKGSDEFVGTICLFGLDDNDDRCEIGYELLPAYHGLGIMKEAVQSIIQYAFGVLKVKTIAALSHKDNQRSIHLLDKLSFQYTSNPAEKDPHLVCYQLTNTNQLL